jgi:hypothetical protein
MDTPQWAVKTPQWLLLLLLPSWLLPRPLHLLRLLWLPALR